MTKQYAAKQYRASPCKTCGCHMFYVYDSPRTLASGEVKMYKASHCVDCTQVRSEKHIAANREQHRVNGRRWYNKNKKAINAKRRQQRAEGKIA